jgi:hypothetical protein
MRLLFFPSMILSERSPSLRPEPKDAVRDHALMRKLARHAVVPVGDRVGGRDPGPPA